MTSDSELLQRIRKSNLDEVEAAWNARMPDAPADLRWFFNVARELRTVKAHAKMAELMLLLVDSLAIADAWEPAFDVLRETLDLVPKNKDVRAKVVESVRARYESRKDLSEILAFFNVEAAEEPLRVFDRLRAWLRFAVGEGFWLFGRGLGKVADINLALQRVEVRFEKAAPLVMRADEAQRLLVWIPKDHFMMRRLADPEGVAKEVQAAPGESVRDLLRCFSRPLTATEIRDTMTGIVEGGKFTGWWTRARAHPQLLASREKKGAFEWTESAESADRAVLQEFEDATFETRLELARRHAKRGGGVKERIVEHLREELAEIVAAHETSSRAVELACLLEEIGAGDASALVPDDVFKSPQAATLITDVTDRRYREKLYRRLRTVREDWVDVFRTAIFAESDQRLVSQLYEDILAHAPAGVAERLVADVVANPRRAPRAFVWITRNALEREELRPRANLSLLTKVVDALASPEFKDLRAPLREHFDEGGLAFAVFDGCDLDGTDRLLNLLDASTLEDHRKLALRRAIFRRHPHIRRRVDEEEVHPAIAESVEAKRRELEQLVKVEIPQNAEAIRVAREFGDLRENFEYHAARQKHEILGARAARLHTELGKVRVLDPASVDLSRVSVGTKFELEPVKGGSTRTVTILGAWESNPSAGVYSHRSDFAKELLGLRTGDVVTLEDVEYRVSGLRPWVAASAAVAGAAAISSGGAPAVSSEGAPAASAEDSPPPAR